VSLLVKDVDSASDLTYQILTIYPPVSIENFSDNNCLSGDYEVSFDVSYSSGVANFFVNGIAYTGSYSELFPDGTAYNLNVVDENGCSEFFLSGNHNCGCTTNAGSMIDINPHYSCDSLCVDTRRLTLQLYKCITMS